MKKSACVMCEDGEYRDVTITDNMDLHNGGFGVSFIGRTGWRAAQCSKCGNVQMFRYAMTEQEVAAR